MPLSLQLEIMPLEEKVPEAPPPKTMVVRYGYLREIGEFPSDITGKVGCGTKVIIRSARGTEIGEMLTTVCGNGGCSKSITRDKLLAYIDSSGGRDYPFTDQGRVLRVASTQDLAEQSKLDEQRNKHLTMARDLVIQHRLGMKVVDVEHVLGGERILFYFVAEQRVDFRGLVRDLAHGLHTRIELRQVGARDEARITADYEKCGQHCCCKQFLKVLTPISMRAAKVQKATLDPTKISGRCGRLMCCLRYEDETYEELRKKLPKRNTRVKTEKGDAWVLDGQILTQLVLVQFDDGKREAVPMEKILGFEQPKPVGPDGRIMQTPNDRPPPGMEGPPPRGGRGGPSNGGPARERPRPGAPAQAPEGDPLAAHGPTGGDLTAGDEIDDLIADAMDGGSPQAKQASPSFEPENAPPVSPDASADQGAGSPQPPVPPRPPMQQPRPPFQGKPGQGGPHRQSFKPGPQRNKPFQGPRPQQGRGPQQGFRPPQQQRPQNLPPQVPPQVQQEQPPQAPIPQPPQSLPPQAQAEPPAPPTPPPPPAQSPEAPPPTL